LTRLARLPVLLATLLGSAVLRSAVLLSATVLRTLLTAVLGTLLTALLRATLLGAAVRTTLLGPVLLGAAVRAGLLGMWLLRVARPARTLLGREVLSLPVTVLRLTVLRAAGTWIRRWLILVGHKLPRWLRWPHRRTCKG
ncbi:MAG TPA: hypothetical protein VFH76_25910, partial [Kribbella sp.]|nr:hypothetical protein [Kribbella sp.]